jgi:DNA-binding response OmpR family regulator
MTSRKGILILDDEQSILESITLAFQEEFNVFTAASGDEALQQLDQENIHLLFLDLKLAGEDGLDVLKKIKVKKPNVKVLVLTGKWTNEEESKQAKSLGVTDFVIKPFDLFNLTNQVKLLLQEASS